MRSTLCLMLLAVAACGGAPATAPDSASAGPADARQVYVQNMLGRWAEDPAACPTPDWEFTEDAIAAPGGVGCTSMIFSGGADRSVRLVASNCHVPPRLHGDVVVDLTLEAEDRLTVEGVYFELDPITMSRCPA